MLYEVLGGTSHNSLEWQVQKCGLSFLGNGEPLRGLEWMKRVRHPEQCFKTLNLLVVGHMYGKSWS